MSEASAILKSVASLIEARGTVYGDVRVGFERAAAIATLKLGRLVDAYEVVTIMESVKDSRSAVDATHADSHIDRINYAAFRALLAPKLEGA